VKLHLCAGDIYLEGYTNCDIMGRKVTHAPSDATTLEEYYSQRAIGEKKPTRIDLRLDLLSFPWPFADSSVDEVVMIQGIEHFTLAEAGRIVTEIRRILKTGGKFLVDFPDVEETVKLYIHNDPKFCMRFIYCNHKNKYSVHHWGYTPGTFMELMGDGWRFFFREIVKHDYPTIGCEAVKV